MEDTDTENNTDLRKHEYHRTLENRMDCNSWPWVGGQAMDGLRPSLGALSNSRNRRAPSRDWREYMSEQPFLGQIFHFIFSQISFEFEESTRIEQRQLENNPGVFYSRNILGILGIQPSTRIKLNCQPRLPTFCSYVVLLASC